MNHAARQFHGSNGNGRRPMLANPDAERAALGCLILDNRLWGTFCEQVKDAHLIELAIEEFHSGKTTGSGLFCEDQNEVVFGAIAWMFRHGRPVDLTLLATELLEHGQLEAVGGAPFLAALEEDIFAPGQVGEYARIIVEKWRARDFINRNRRASELAAAGRIDDAVELMADALEVVGRRDNGVVPLDIWTPLRALEYDPPENDSILDDRIIAAGELTALIGPPDLGKSRIATQLAFDLALMAKEFLGRLPIHRHGLKVLFIQTENRPRRVRTDCAAQLRGCTGEQRARALELIRYVIPARPEDSCLNLDDPQNVARLEQAVKAVGPDLIVWDPLGDFYAGDSENDAVAMRLTVRMIMRISQAAKMETAVLIVHHARSGKTAAAGADGWDRGAYGRGSKALLSMCRAAINLAPGDKDGQSIVVACGKNNNGRRFETFAVRLDPDTLRYELDPDFDLTAWQDEVSSPGNGNQSRKKVTPELVMLVLKQLGNSAKRPALVKAVCEAADSKSSAVYDRLKAMLADHSILEWNGLITIPISEREQ